MGGCEVDALGSDQVNGAWKRYLAERCIHAVWIEFHWVAGKSRWSLLIPAGIGAVLCAFAMWASDPAIRRFVETDAGEC